MAISPPEAALEWELKYFLKNAIWILKLYFRKEKL